MVTTPAQDANISEFQNSIFRGDWKTEQILNNQGNDRHYQSATRQAMNVSRTIDKRSQNHCCCGKALSLTYFCVCVRVGAVGWRVPEACSLTNRECNAPPYCHLSPPWLHHVFRHYLTNGMIFGKKLLNTKCVL